MTALFVNDKNKLHRQFMVTEVSTTSNILEAEKEINRLINDGYERENLYIIAHRADRAEHVAEFTNTNTIDSIEESLTTSIANLFRSHSEELCAKLRTMGVSRILAEKLEADMAKGKIVILAWDKDLYRHDRFEPQSVDDYPFMDY